MAWQKRESLLSQRTLFIDPEDSREGVQLLMCCLKGRHVRLVDDGYSGIHEDGH